MCSANGDRFRVWVSRGRSPPAARGCSPGETRGSGESQQRRQPETERQPPREGDARRGPAEAATGPAAADRGDARLNPELQIAPRPKWIAKLFTPRRLIYSREGDFYAGSPPGAIYSDNRIELWFWSARVTEI